MWNNIQDSWFQAVNRFAENTPWLHEPMRLYAEYGIVLFAGILLLSWWVSRTASSRVTAAALWAPLGAIAALGLNQPLAHAVAEHRPFETFPDALMLVARSFDYSFPSDHAVMAGAVTAGVFLANRRLGWWTLAAALVMAFARVYVGAHFPLDVIFGLAFGALVSLAGYWLLRPVMLWLVERLERTPLRPLLTVPEPDPGA